MTLKRTMMLGLCLLLASASARALAVDVVFTFDSNASLTVAGGEHVFDGSTILSQPQYPGSDVAPVQGNFVVSFDPTDVSPGSLQFKSGGYVSMGNGATSALPGGDPANAAISINGLNIAFRNVTWQMSSPAINLSGTSYDASQVSYNTLSGQIDLDFLGTVSTAGTVGPVTPADFGNLVQTSAGHWALSMPVAVSIESEPLFGDVTGVLQATAEFSSNNVAQVDVPTAPTDVLGGSGVTGGVTAQFGEGTTAGVFAAQQVPLSGLPLAAVSGLANFGINSLSTDAQLWDLQYSGTLSGPVTVTLSYDPSRLPAALQADPSGLHVEHFNTATGLWESLGGTVDGGAHTITFQTESFSPFLLTVPEPSTWALSLVAAAMLLGRSRLARRFRPSKS